MTLTYRDAGVDIDAGNEAVRRIRGLARSTFRPEVIGDIGFFGGLFRLGSYRQPVLVSSADGVGTKLKIAIAMGQHSTVGADLVNHCINDIFVGGAEPLFFLDYLAMGQVDPAVVEALVSGMANACKAAGCALIGGETAEMPGVYHGQDYDLAGFIVGVVEEDRIIDGSRIAAGDVLLGLPSSGLHTNGYSLVRRAFGISDDPASWAVLSRHHGELGMTLGEALLAVHRCYAPALQPHLERIAGMAHITGGGLEDNLARIMPSGLAARIDWGAWAMPPLFGLIQQRGNVPLDDLRRTLNCGIGMVAVCNPADAAVLAGEFDAIIIGEVVPVTL